MNEVALNTLLHGLPIILPMGSAALASAAEAAAGVWEEGGMAGEGSPLDAAGAGSGEMPAASPCAEMAGLEGGWAAAPPADRGRAAEEETVEGAATASGPVAAACASAPAPVALMAEPLVSGVHVGVSM